MPISYSVYGNGHYIHAVARGVITRDEFIEYEVSHAIDKRIAMPVSELLEVQYGALRNIKKDDVDRVLRRRTEVKDSPVPHRCAIVVSYADSHAWELAKFYEGMAILHSPESVIVFGDSRTARVWLGWKNTAREKRNDVNNR